MAVWVALAIAILSSSAAATPSVSYDGRSFIIDGARELLLSGGMHYNRVPRADWDGVMKMAKELGKAESRKQTYASVSGTVIARETMSSFALPLFATPAS